MKITELPLDDRPREKMFRNGPSSLSNAELIAILLNTGIKGKNVVELARELLLTNNNSLKCLAQKTYSALNFHSKEKLITGLGAKKISALIAAFELSRRIEKEDSHDLFEQPITNPKLVADFFRKHLRDEQIEKFFVVCLNIRNKIIDYREVASGTLGKVNLSVRNIFKLVIETNSSGIIVLHNHPSGNVEPSANDIQATRAIKLACENLEIRFLDHIIVGKDTSYSFLEEGKI